jgi:DNA-binding MurR/RpiR family transcriptional regulator
MIALASRLGLHTVAITSSPNTPVARNAEKVLATPCYFISFIDSYAGPVSFLNALILAVSRRKFGDAVDRFANLEALWKEKGTYFTDERF